MSHKSTKTADAGQLVDDAQELLAATGHIAEEKVIAARARLTAAIKQGRVVLDRLKDRAVAGAKATDETIREHPYQALGVALGAGLLLGFILRKRRS